MAPTEREIMWPECYKHAPPSEEGNMVLKRRKEAPTSTEEGGADSLAGAYDVWVVLTMDSHLVEHDKLKRRLQKSTLVRLRPLGTGSDSDRPVTKVGIYWTIGPVAVAPGSKVVESSSFFSRRTGFFASASKHVGHFG